MLEQDDHHPRRVEVRQLEADAIDLDGLPHERCDQHLGRQLLEFRQRRIVGKVAGPVEFLLSLLEHARGQLLVRLADRGLHVQVDRLVLEGVELRVVQAHHRLLVVADGLLDLVGEGHHQVHDPGLQVPECGLLILDDTLNLEPALLILRELAHLLGERGVVRGDEDRAQRRIGVPDARAEDEQDEERADHQGEQQAGLAQRLEDLLDDERGDPDQASHARLRSTSATKTSSKDGCSVRMDSSG